MIYVALLRGINVGGKAKVPMIELKAMFERIGFTRVTTYINSGNVIFESTLATDVGLTKRIEKEILLTFTFEVPVIVRSLEEIRVLVAELPSEYANDAEQRTDVLFLWPDMDSPSVLTAIAAKPEIETVRYAPGAIIWNIKRENVTKSGLLKIVGTPLYKQMTLRNVNTVRKLEALMIAASL